MKAQSLKGLILIALVIAIAPFKAKADAESRVKNWKYESRVRIQAAIQMAQSEIEESQRSTPENVFDFSEEGFQIVVVNPGR